MNNFDKSIAERENEGFHCSTPQPTASAPRRCRITSRPRRPSSCEIQRHQERPQFRRLPPGADDFTAPWSRRFPHQRTLLMNIGRSQTTWRTLGKGGKLLDGGSHKGDFKEAAEHCSAEWRAATDEAGAPSR